MAEIKKTDTGFKIVNIYLMETSFKRIPKVNFEEGKIKRSADVNVDVKVEGNLILVTEILTYSQWLDEVEEVTAKLKMVGVFEKVGDTLIDPEQFGKINAAAILYPYLREHLTNLSVKAGLGAVLLPPFNFAAPIEESN